MDVGYCHRAATLFGSSRGLSFVYIAVFGDKPDLPKTSELPISHRKHLLTRRMRFRTNVSV